MTEAELVALAQTEVPELQGIEGRIVRGAHADVPLRPTTAESDEAESEPLEELEQLLGFELPAEPPPEPGTADVAFRKTTKLGVRTTVVQIRSGRVVRVIGQ